MPVDTSIYANQQHPDPLAGVGSALNIANAFTQRQLLQTNLQRQQLGLQGDQGVAATYSDPSILNSDGTVNTSAVNNRLVRNGAGISAPGTIATNTNTAGGQIANTSASTALNQSQSNYLASQLNPLFNDPKNPPKSSDVSAVISNAIAAGTITPQAGNALTIEMLHNSGTPQQLKQWAQNRFVGSMGTGQAEPGATVTTPAGTTTLSKGQTATATQGGSAEAPSVPAAPAPGVGVSPGTGVIESYKAANDQHMADYASSTATLGNTRNLATALDKLNQLNPSDAGAVGDLKNKVLTTAVALGLAPSTTTMTREEAEKYLEKSKASMPAAQRSDMAQSLADVSSPNLHTSLEATKALTRSAIGFARMDAAVPFSWDAAHPNQVKGQTDPDYLKYRPQFMNSQDPDAYVFDTLSAPEQQAIIADKQRQGKAAVAKFRSSLQNYDRSIGGPSGQIGQ
jgi:hypothetical protein